MASSSVEGFGRGDVLDGGVFGDFVHVGLESPVLTLLMDALALPTACAFASLRID
jgi:hypothetical protein